MSSRNRLRFLIIGNNGPSLINFRLPLIRHIVAKGHQVTAISPLNDLCDSTAKKIKSDLYSLGVDLVSVDLARTGLNPAGDLLYLNRLINIIRTLHPDRILAYAIKPAIYAGFASLLLRHRHFYPMLTGLGHAFTDGAGVRKTALRSIVSLLLKHSFKGANTVIFQNPDDEQFMRESGILAAHTKSATVSGSGVDLDHFSRVPLKATPSTPYFFDGFSDY